MKNENIPELAEARLKILDILLKQINEWHEDSEAVGRGVMYVPPLRFISKDKFISRGIVTEQLENFCKDVYDQTGVDLLGTLQGSSFLDKDRGKIKNDQLVVLAYTSTREKLETLLSRLRKDAINSEVPQLVGKPFCYAEGKLGFLKFNKHSRGIKISKASSQPFMLLQALTEQFGVAKSVDTIFEAIEKNVRDKKGIYKSNTDRARKVYSIKYGIKELQKIKGLQSKLEYEWDDVKTKLWVKYVGD